ncbi:MAG: YoaK family protein [Eubacteriales bacterium]|nr:YoaK family protein [Eubacteriales bacterium]
MKNHEDLTCWIHHSMAITGGYLGVYALLCREDFFGNALTSNLIYIVTSILGTNFFDVLIRIVAVLIYAAGIASTNILSKKYHKNLHPIALSIDFIAVFILGFLPEDMNPVIGLYPIFFAMAFQWNSFPGAYGFAASPIFSTNNTRQVVNALCEYYITHEKKHLKKAWFFGGTLICFHIGVVLSWIAHSFLGIRSVWLCVIPLLFSTVLIGIECHQPYTDQNRRSVISAPMLQKMKKL